MRVERCEDDEEEICTQVETASSEEFLLARKNLHPEREMTVESVRAFVRNVRTAEMTEAFFAHVVMVVEGPSEREAIPIFARSQGLDFDEHGVSIVSAGGKSAIDTLFQLYDLHGLKTYTIFDNDGGKPSEKNANHTLCRLLGRKEEDEPPACVEEDYAILQGNWERQCRAHVEILQPGLYDELEAQARVELNISGDRNKPLVARFVAEALVERGYVPQFVKGILDEVRKKLPPLSDADGVFG